ncbi:hypothetical protein DLAC_09160 [Tieghemostelium lacteum]|uniref:Uncharacterized protein n=1 Tax=Tieghemostelium lacteum TaxID=361077 RepID=A0A151Z9B6_TIELA|nr:hypothetical protein DLAC_09160 [Tieghemostelium lacteum]|eukprot:KYQ90535.1 hypothetical protein DLAC_09160 [Tieghemostelium lacteum]
MHTDNDWQFITKFCYGTEGPGSISVEATANNNNTLIVLYDDQSNSFPEVYKNKDLTCEQKITSTADLKVYIVDNLSFANNVTLPVNNPNQPHFWYIVAAACGQSVDVDYNIEMLNAGGLWKAQFSWDEQGLEALYLFYFFVFLFLTVYTIYSSWVLIQSRSFHPVAKLLSLAIYLEFFSVFILLIHYGVYSHNGVGGNGVQGFGELLDLSAQLAFILLLILISKGWAISRVNLEDKKIIMGVMGGLSALYLIMFIWYKAGQDPASSVYMYDTVPGILLLIARSLAMIWFMWCAYNTYMEEHHPSKRQFYLYFGIAFVAWFISLPFICIIAAAVDPWVRLKTVIAFYVTFNALAFTAVAFLLAPSRANEYFSISSGSSSSSSNTASYETF